MVKKVFHERYVYVAIFVLTLVVLAFISISQKPERMFGLSAAKYGTEVYWQDIIHEELTRRSGWESIGKEVRLDDGTRVDLLFPNQACEIDWANKWAEGVGQSIYYGLKTRRAPLVLLLVKKDGWEKYRDRVVYCGVECWVYDTRTAEWIEKE